MSVVGGASKRGYVPLFANANRGELGDTCSFVSAEEESRALTWLGLVSCLAMVCIAALLPPMQDYPAYLSQWQAVLDGANPWADPTNSYGPTHALVGAAVAIHPYVPRLLFAALFSGTTFWLWLRIRPLASKKTQRTLFVLLFLNPLFVVFAAGCGNNDAIMAVLLMLSLWAYDRGNDVGAGAAMAAAIAVKLLPICMLPFLVVSRRGLRWRFALSVVGLTAAIHTGCYLIFGAEVFDPLFKAVGRPSKGVSIFHFLRSELSPLHWFLESPNLDRLSTIASALALVGLFALHLKRRFEPVTSSLISIGLLLTLYKVGHYQFYLSFELVALYWLARPKERRFLESRLAPVALFIGWLAVLSISYMAFHGHFGHGTEWVRQVLAVPHLLFSVWMLAHLFKLACKESSEEQRAA